MNYPFTVKICEFNGGETVMPARVIEAIPSNPDKESAVMQEIAMIRLVTDLPNFPCEEITSGAVYIMNETGKTIARYTIGDKP